MKNGTLSSFKCEWIIEGHIRRELKRKSLKYCEWAMTEDENLQEMFSTSSLLLKAFTSDFLLLIVADVYSRNRMLFKKKINKCILYVCY